MPSVAFYSNCQHVIFHISCDLICFILLGFCFHGGFRRDGCLHGGALCGGFVLNLVGREVVALVLLG